VLCRSNPAATRPVDGGPAHTTNLKESAMTHTSHIRRIALIALIGCAVLATWTSPASARMIDDPSLPSVPATGQTVQSGSSTTGDLMLVVAFGVTALVAIGAVGYAYRVRPGHRSIA
jgi:hypothetical protein